MNSDQIKQALLTENLSHEELMQFQAIVGLRLGKSREAVKIEVELVAEKDHAVSLLYSCLHDLVQQKLGQQVPHLGALKRINAALYHDVVVCTNSLLEFFEANINAKSSRRYGRPQQIAFFRLFLRLAYENSVAIGGNITTQRLMKMHDRCGTLMDRAFPGYIESGMLAYVLTGARTFDRTR